MLKVKKVTKYFGNIKAVNELSFELDKGDITGLLGPNGAGKTTTMRMITSYYYPSKGDITVNGRNTQKSTIETQKMIGYMPENNPLYMDMLVIDYLQMTAKLNGVKKSHIAGRIEEVARDVGIENKLATVIGQLSKGYKQRVGIAAALIHDPEILILDEPTEGLDPNQRHEIHKLVKKLSKDKVILISTHVLQEVKAMCNRVVIINNGRLVREGTPDQLTGHKTLMMQLEGHDIKDKIGEILKAADGEKVKIHKGKEDYGKDVQEVTVTTSREVRPEISELIAKNKWTVWEIQIQDSLEEIFSELKQ